MTHPTDGPRSHFLIHNPLLILPLLIFGDSIPLISSLALISVFGLSFVCISSLLKPPRYLLLQEEVFDLPFSCASQRYKVINYRDTIRSKPKRHAVKILKALFMP